MHILLSSHFIDEGPRGQRSVSPGPTLMPSVQLRDGSTIAYDPIQLQVIKTGKHTHSMMKTTCWFCGFLSWPETKLAVIHLPFLSTYSVPGTDCIYE